MNTFIDSSVEVVIKRARTGAVALLVAVSIGLLSALAQAPITAGMLPGDVLFIDPATTQPFIWLHAATGRMELMPGYTPEQAYRLLLDREQACWDVANDYMRRTQVAPVPVQLPKPHPPK